MYQRVRRTVRWATGPGSLRTGKRQAWRGKEFFIDFWNIVLFVIFVTKYVLLFSFIYIHI